MSETTIYDRLSEAQKAVINPKADGEGHATQTRKYGYSTLANVLDIVRPACNSNGLFLSQRVGGKRDDLHIVTSVSCGSERLVLDCFPLEYDRNPQRFGSAVTYAKRYSLISAFGVACKDEDDDGAAGSPQMSAPKMPAPKQPRPPKQPNQPKQKPKPTKNQKAVSDAMRKAKECGMSLAPLKKWAEAYFGKDVVNLNDGECSTFAIKINEEIEDHMQPVDEVIDQANGEAVAESEEF